MTEPLLVGAGIFFFGTVFGITITMKVAQAGAKFLIEQSKRAQHK
jgi:hypothetical protein